MTLKERTEDMVARYGEVCRKVDAARILHRCGQTINTMLEDGRLQKACGGTMVDVRSIAAYICAPEVCEDEARKERYRRRNGCKWVV